MVAPTTPIVDWCRIKADYVAGNRVRELSKRYGVKSQTIQQRVFREKWIVKRQEVQNLVVKNAAATIAARAREWTDAQFSRMIRFRASVSQSLMEVSGDGFNTKDRPVSLDQLTKAEMRIDDMGRRALGLVDPKCLDITSGGMPLGAFGDALQEVRKIIQAGGASARTIDVEEIAGTAMDGESGSDTAS